MCNKKWSRVKPIWNLHVYPFSLDSDSLKEVEKANLGIQLSSGKKVRGLLFADDFVGGCNSVESLLILYMGSYTTV